MRRLVIASIAALACSAAHAEVAANTPGQWINVRNRIALGDLADSSEPIARLEYAKHVTCGAYNTGAAYYPANAPYVVCMKTQGFVYVFDSPAQIAARKKTIERAQPPVVIIAPAPPAIDFQPHGCNGYIGGGGNFNMNCN